MRAEDRRVQRAAQAHGKRGSCGEIRRRRGRRPGFVSWRAHLLEKMEPWYSSMPWDGGMRSHPSAALRVLGADLPAAATSRSVSRKAEMSHEFGSAACRDRDGRRACDDAWATRAADGTLYSG